MIIAKMWLIYRIGIWIYGRLVRILSLFNDKAKKWAVGRRGVLARVTSDVDASKGSIWFHFASLGEFEQGRPVLEALKLHRPNRNIVITFYSPSGYEIRKNTPLADHVYYLPEDTPRNAKAFIRLINPVIAVFTKYEYWPYYFRTLATAGVPLYVISAIFRPNQVFFKWHGGLFRQTLRRVTHFFTQNEQSRTLLAGLGLTNTTLAGDTRFDRVVSLPETRKAVVAVAAFATEASVLVAGSTWPADETLLAQLHQKFPDWKIIIAPHEIHEEHLLAIERLFPYTVRFSALNAQIDQSKIETAEGSIDAIKSKHDINNPKSHVYRQAGRAYRQAGKILLVDNMGMLSSLYGYGHAAYIGGGFGAGIHNTLEAAAYGIPVIFGPNYQKFQEAKGLISVGGGISFGDMDGLIKAMDTLTDEKARQHAGVIAGRYVQEHAGATDIIVRHLLNEQPGSDVVGQ